MHYVRNFFVFTLRFSLFKSGCVHKDLPLGFSDK